MRAAPIAQAPLYATSANGYVGTPIALSTSGGSGSSAVSDAVSIAGSASCSVTSGVLSASSVGTCLVAATKAGDATYLAVTSDATTVSFTYRPATAPLAIRMSSPVFTSRSTVTSVFGAYCLWSAPHIQQRWRNQGRVACRQRSSPVETRDDRCLGISWSTRSPSCLPTVSARRCTLSSVGSPHARRTPDTLRRVRLLD